MILLTMPKIFSPKKTLLLISLVMYGITAHAESILLVGKHTVVTNIDGQRIKSGFFSTPPKKFNLPAGKHQITAKYDRLFDLNSDEHDILRSVEITLPVTLLDKQSYTLDMINQPNQYQDAKKYVTKPTLGLMLNGQVITQKTAIKGSHRKKPTIVNRTNHVTQPKIQPAQTSQPAQISDNSQTSNPQTSNPQKSDVLDNFMQLWLKATTAERQKIRNWVQEQ